MFVGINTNSGNSGYLDIFLEGEAAGWVAVGFSETQNMVRDEQTTNYMLVFMYKPSTLAFDRETYAAP